MRRRIEPHRTAWLPTAMSGLTYAAMEMHAEQVPPGAPTVESAGPAAHQFSEQVCSCRCRPDRQHAMRWQLRRPRGHHTCMHIRMKHCRTVGRWMSLVIDCMRA